MATLTSALDTEFTPAAGDFIIQVVGVAQLWRKNTSGATFRPVCGIDNLPVTFDDVAAVISNPVAGAVYKFVAAGTATVQADQ